MSIRLGTSGWVYNHWRGIYYPKNRPQRDGFAYYAREFDTVKINNSFYRLPSADAFDTWRKQAPSGLLCAVKASQYLTHMKKLRPGGATPKILRAREPFEQHARSHSLSASAELAG